MLTYKQARAHAQRCGIKVHKVQAVPAALMQQPRMLAADVLHPETLDSIMLSGTIVHPEFVRMMAIHAGFDYVVCH